MAEQVTLKDPYREKRIYQMRVVVISIFVVALLLLVVARYFSLQITQHDNYKTQSDRNRVQLQAIPPKRGLIYDRNGSLLAENLPSYSLTIVKEQVGNLDETISLLQQLLYINEDHIKTFQRLLTRRRSYSAIPLKLNLSEEEIAIISVNGYRLPGVDVDAQLARHYPRGALFAHTLGYVGRISEEEQWGIDEINYSGTLQIGKIGLEKYYEEELHGIVGSQNVETNARGRVLRVLERDDPEPGIDIRLHMDSYTQEVAYKALAGRRGAVVAIDPKTGGVIAMVSTPSFDSNLFVGGISRQNYSDLRNSADLPLFNRALQGQYPPASTVKPFYGLAGLHYKVVTEETTVRDPGWYQIPDDSTKRLYRDWTWRTKRSGHGKYVALEQSIVESCDTYYYDLSYKLGIDRIQEFMSPFGYGEKTGIDNTNERSGLLPSREWKRRHKRLPWFPGETLSLGIGQGYLLATPLQLAVA
ncbi:MAG: penicillin-binding protein 2, partial [Gammaproteobacteria bacterium]